MRLHLDTDFLIYALARSGDERKRLLELSESDAEIQMSAAGEVAAEPNRGDLDFLVTFKPEAEWSLVDHVRMQEELAEMTHREVDLVSRRGIERSANQLRRDAILGEARAIYAAR